MPGKWMHAKVAALTAALLAGTGCERFAANYRVDDILPKLGDAAENMPQSSAIKDFIIVIQAQENGKLPDVTSALLAADAKTRNAAVDTLIMYSDRVCAEHQSKIMANATGLNLGLGSTTTILGGLGALFSPASTARALAGSAGMTNALRSGMNEDIYMNFVHAAILKKIGKEREDKLNAIRERQQSTVDKYRPIEAMSDVVAYHQACSFYTAMARLATDSEKRVSLPEELSQRIGSVEANLKTVDSRIDVHNGSKPEAGTPAYAAWLAQRERLTSWKQNLERMLEALQMTAGFTVDERLRATQGR